MVKTRILITIIFSVGIYIGTSAQDRIIQGVVTTFDSIPLTGVDISSKETRQVVKTDTSGVFSITCAGEDVLTVSANGYYSQKVKVTSKVKIAAINLKMKPGEKNREYSVGYWTVSDRDKMSAIVGMNDEDADFSQYSNMLELIQGRFAGVQVIGGEIRIRGINTFIGSMAALIILDGMAVDYSVLNNLPPSQVKSIDVIKDGTASIYGARGANGVVIIQTKK
jgi:TonB-dependent SusC/RagA subfamily outer membrane receptor